MSLEARYWIKLQQFQDLVMPEKDSYIPQVS